MATDVITELHHLRELVGQEIGVTGWRTLSQKRINDFSEATGDCQWIHLDMERALAHGFLGLSLITGFVKDLVNITAEFSHGINYGLNHVRFPAPIPAGSKIRARVGLQSLEEIESGIQFVWIVTVETEKAEKPSVVAEWVTRSYR